MLEGLFTPIESSGGLPHLKAIVGLNAAHPLFAGHFPGQPVLPGVSQLQLFKETAEAALGKKLRIDTIRELKFLSPVLPALNKQLEVTLELNVAEENSIIIRGTIQVGEVQKTKIKATFAY